MIGKPSILEERELPIPLSNLAVCSPELVRCFRHEGERCPRCDGSGYRSRIYCTECGEPAGRPGRGGKALMGLRNRRSGGTSPSTAWTATQSWAAVWRCSRKWVANGRP